MKAQQNRLFPETTLNSVLVMRPLSMSIFEDMGVNPYQNPACRMEDVCKAAGMEWKTLADRIQALPVPARNSDWGRLPISHLLDFLTQEHRDFVESFLPAIQSAFASGEGNAEFLAGLHPILRAWPAFSTSLIEHMAAEEAFLFPKILRYAYCAGHRRADPDFSDGSVKAFAAVHLLRGEEKQMAALGRFLEAAAFAGTMEGAASGVFRLLQSFHVRLVEHSRMEREILYPMAQNLEKRLYDAYIQGEPARIDANDLNFA